MPAAHCAPISAPSCTAFKSTDSPRCFLNPVIDVWDGLQKFRMALAVRLDLATANAWEMSDRIDHDIQIFQKPEDPRDSEPLVVVMDGHTTARRFDTDFMNATASHQFRFDFLHGVRVTMP